MPMQTTVELRWLQFDDILKLKDIFVAQGWVIPNTQFARFLVGFDGDRIVSMIGFEMKPMIGPMWLDEEYRGNGLAEEMTDTMVEWLYEVNCPEAFMVGRSPHSAKLAEKHGMVKLPYATYYRRA